MNSRLLGIAAALGCSLACATSTAQSDSPATQVATAGASDGGVRYGHDQREFDAVLNEPRKSCCTADGLGASDPALLDAGTTLLPDFVPGTAPEPSPTQGQGEGALPPRSADEKALAAVEQGTDNDDAAGDDGLETRASGKPDHPRTLEEIKASGYIRVLTRNNDTSFFIYRGHRMGFDYELGKKLAQRLGIRVDMVITNEWEEMIPALLRGEGDVIAAEMTVTPEREKQVRFAQPWAQTREVVVWKAGTPPIHAPEELSGKEVHVRKGTTYVDTLESLNRQLQQAGKPPVRIALISDDLETDTILTGISKGEYVYTVADDLLAQIHTTYFDNLIVGPALGPEQELAWAVRPGDRKLAREIDELFHDLRKRSDFNLVRKKYFEAERDFKKRGKDRFYASETGTLSPYDPLVLKYSEPYGFDWRLVAAQIYQESRFDPKNRSWVGAQGLFQIMPATARSLGIVDPTDPEQSIRGGLKYMSQLARHYEDVPDPIERYRFALAAYNSGFGHVDDARHLAKVAGANPALWKEVAPWLLKLANRKVARKARFGFCRGMEPVDYVRHIDERYAGYAQLVPKNSGK